MRILMLFFCMFFLFYSCASNDHVKEYAIYKCNQKEWDHYIRLFETVGVSRCTRAYKITQGAIMSEFEEQLAGSCETFVRNQAKKGHCCVIEHSPGSKVLTSKQCPNEAID